MSETALNLPHRRMEAWKWTDVSRAVTKQTGLSSQAELSLDVPEGVFSSRGDGHSSDTVMGKLASQFAGESHNVYVSPGTHPEAPLKLSEISSGHACIAIMVDKGSSLTLIEDYAQVGAAFSNIDCHIHLAEGAKLTRLVRHNDSAESVRVSTTCMACETGAEIEQYVLSFGSALTRIETRVYGEGEGITARLNGAYLLDGKRHTDLTTHVELKSPNCEILQDVKGVTTDRARGVFQGKFHVEREAQHTDAEMRHDALMLSDTAEIRAKPELEIYADDVACAHGNTIGQLDESALFYMRQRGIPAPQARALLTEAFVKVVFDELSDESIRDDFVNQIGDWLNS